MALRQRPWLGLGRRGAALLQPQDAGDPAQVRSGPTRPLPRGAVSGRPTGHHRRAEHAEAEPVRRAGADSRPRGPFLGRVRDTSPAAARHRLRPGRHLAVLGAGTRGVGHRSHRRTGTPADRAALRPSRRGRGPCGARTGGRPRPGRGPRVRRRLRQREQRIHRPDTAVRGRRQGPRTRWLVRDPGALRGRVRLAGVHGRLLQNAAGPAGRIPGRGRGGRLRAGAGRGRDGLGGGVLGAVHGVEHRRTRPAESGLRRPAGSLDLRAARTVDDRAQQVLPAVA